MPHPDWNESYLAGPPPWDTGEPSRHLVEFIGSGAIERGRVLDVGCGTGTNALWLAQQGYSVLAVDIAPAAIEKARAKATGTTLDCRFERMDFLVDTVPGGPFAFVFDLGCFHVFDEPRDRQRFAARVASLLEPNGCWLSIIGSTEGPGREWGPPRRSAREIVDAVEPALEIRELHAVGLGVNGLPAPVAAWRCLSRPRAVPAVSSARRD
jgi:methyl halide transferase